MTMTATDIANFQSAVGEFVDAMASFRKTVAYHGSLASMQAENARRIAQGLGPCYGEVDFYHEAKVHGFVEHD